jgi:hypothetical protein
MVNDSVGRGDFVGFKTASTTDEILPGRFVELSGGSVVLPTTTPGQAIGVAHTKVASRTSATSEDIIVQVSGLAHVACAANEGFSAGDLIANGAVGVATTFASVAGTTFSSEEMRNICGVCMEPDATTTGTTILAKLRCM